MKIAVMKSLLICVLILLFLSSCDKQIEDKGRIIAEINGNKITEEEFLDYCRIDSLDDISEEEIRAKIEEWAKIVLLAHEAEKRGLVDNSRISFRAEMAGNLVKANVLLAAMVYDIEPTENELFNFYQIHRSSYVREVQEYRVQRILLASEAMADSVSNSIINNELNFAEAAQRYSQERASETNGYIGYLTTDEMSDSVRNAVTSLSQWRFTRIPASNGFYLIRYTDMRNREVEKSFTDVTAEVKERYLEEMKSDLVNSLVDDLMRQAEIIIVH